jgi:hypothetical protein
MPKVKKFRRSFLRQKNPVAPLTYWKPSKWTDDTNLGVFSTGIYVYQQENGTQLYIRGDTNPSILETPMEGESTKETIDYIKHVQANLQEVELFHIRPDRDSISSRQAALRAFLHGRPLLLDIPHEICPVRVGQVLTAWRSRLHLINEYS